ncbi:malate synthase A [Kordiimonas lacus]|uniref:Malate synthase n=1 Tax=Kordiimonas lacus TaxID=637679 RepID=A0A1G7EH99_9PROT|nr:malate synthase A [Kordiimonas lacus]SDE62815.1 malate synthase [Kordiimonas lacus]
MSAALERTTEPTLDIIAPVKDLYARVLTGDALAFVADLEIRFGGRRKDLMEARAERQKRFDAGELPDFLPETKDIRESDWKILGTPEDLKDRRVEITGPVDRKMMINAFNSGANVFMTDFEDASSPTWENMIDGQINLMDYARGRLEFTDPKSGKEYRMNEQTATLKVRPRGLHMTEVHAELNGQPISASLFDFGLYIFHNASALLARGTGPYFYLPKMESHFEAKLWDDVFTYTEEVLGLEHGTIKTTVLIETLPAAFEMDEILHALKDHIVGLNCGRWDYIFSYIKRIGKHADYLLPDRSQVTMGEAFLKAYSLLLIKTCHRRGAHAMGGMAAQIPVKGDEAANAAAFEKVRADKDREAAFGHDGTWVAHPALVPVARDVFDRLMPQANQLHRTRLDIEIGQKELLAPHTGTITEHGVRENIRVGIQYLGAWLTGRGAVPLYNLMEDAATAEISRTQIWQQLKLSATLDDGRTVTEDLVRDLYADEMVKLREFLGPTNFEDGRLAEAGRLFLDLVFKDELAEFLTTPAYELMTQPGTGSPQFKAAE